MKTRYLIVIVYLIIGASFTLGSGCGKSGDGTVAATGTVTFEGQPVASGVIVFVPFNDPKLSSESGLVKDGRFNLRVKPGKKRIEIHATKAGKIDPDMKQPEQIEYIPAKYNLKSTLEKEVSATGSNEFEFKLTK